MAASSKHQENQAGRDSMGRFRRGASGNPAGRPEGAANRLLRLARHGALEVWPSIMQAARDGDPEARKMVLAFGMPKAKPVAEAEALPFLPAGEKLTEQGRAVLEAAARGEISPDAAAAHMGLLRSLAELRQAEDLETRIAALEAAVKELEP